LCHRDFVQCSLITYKICSIKFYFKLMNERTAEIACCLNLMWPAVSRRLLLILSSVDQNLEIDQTADRPILIVNTIQSQSVHLRLREFTGLNETLHVDGLLIVQNVVYEVMWLLAFSIVRIKTKWNITMKRVHCGKRKLGLIFAHNNSQTYKMEWCQNRQYNENNRLPLLLHYRCVVRW